MRLTRRRVTRTPAFVASLAATGFGDRVEVAITAATWSLERGWVPTTLPSEQTPDGRTIYAMKTLATTACPAVVIAFELSSDGQEILLHRVFLADVGET